TVKLSGPAPLPLSPFPKDAPPLSSFECSDPGLNRIFNAAAARLHEITSVRDIGLCMRAAAFHSPLLPDATTWIDHLNNSTNNLGYYPAKLPSDGSFGSTQSDAAISCAHGLWWMTGDTSSYERNIGTMRRYIFARKDYAKRYGEASFGKLPADTLPQGDPTPTRFIDDATQALNLRLLLDIGRRASQDPYELYSLKQYHESLAKPFAAAHLTDKGTLEYDSVTANVLALRCGLLSTDLQKSAATKQIIEHLADPKTNALKLSPITAQSLLTLLTWTGHLDEAFETARAVAPQDLDPVALMACSEWLISMVAGIDTGEPGFGVLRLQPKIPPSEVLASAKAHYDSPYGRITTSWSHENDGLHFDVTIPPNCLASIELPAGKDEIVTEGGKALASSKIFFATQRTESSISFQSGSGTFRFLVRK
ncbi:MAG: hypothetical protein O3A87_02600, partial [Verrucomicrobia bacterium]|nr:hypothetical protein [Verrucomicrobiota bacterium]